MATNIIMPKQGLQMTEGMITRWLVNEGDRIEQGQPLFEMETDKLTITIDASVSGILLKIVRGELEVVPITETIAIVGEPDEAIGEDAAGSAPIPKPADSRVFATPRAKTAAADRSVDYMTILGSGPDGLVIEKDVLAQIPPSSPAVADETMESITAMRRAIWENMTASLREMAQAHLTVQVDMTETAKMRRAMMMSQEVSFNDIIIKALCHALLEYPEINSAVVGGKLCRKHYVNMGLAVALDKGLIVPTITNAHMLTLAEIHASSAALVEKARKGSLQPQEYSGGTFTVTNLGMYDVDEFDAIINPPQAAILAVGRIADTPVVREGQVVVRSMAKMTLTYDHRIIDGASAAKFMQRVMALLQNPALLQ